MWSLINFLGGLRIRSLNPLMAFVLIFSLSIPTVSYAQSVPPIVWGSNVNVSETSGRSSYSPKVAATGNTVHVIWWDNDSTSQPGSAYYKRSLDGGATWQDLHVFSNALLASGADIVVSGNVVLAFWIDLEGSETVMRYARSTDAGQTWSSSQALSPGDVYSYIASAMGEGRVVALWTEGVGGTTDIKMRLSTDEGQTWGNTTDIITVNSVSAQGDVVIAGSVLVVGFNENDQVYSIRSTDWGQSWSSPTQVSSVPSSETAGSLRLAAFGSSVVMKWGRFIGSYNGETYVAASSDGGATWSSPLVLSEGISGDNRPGDVCIWGNRAVAVWRQNPGPGQEFRLYYRRSLDGGQTWGAAILIHTGNEFNDPQCTYFERSVYVVGNWPHAGGDIWLVRGLDPDTTPPEISVSVNPEVVWPPNHKMVEITATVEVSDDCDPDPSIVLTSITSNEPDDAPGGGDGHTTNDIQGADLNTDDREFLLRAERSGQGDGRIYTITYTATDASGNSNSASATVMVPHDKGKGRAKLALPGTYVLSQNYPNPFNPSTEITYGLPERSYVRLTVYNLLGHEVTRLVDGEQGAGYYAVQWDASGVSGGVYFYRLEAGSFAETKKMMLMR